MTVNEASAYTGIGRNNLRNLIAWEKIPVIRIGNKILIRTEVLDCFLRENEGHNIMLLLMRGLMYGLIPIKSGA